MSVDPTIEHSGLSSLATGDAVRVAGDDAALPKTGEAPNATAASMLGLLTWHPMTGWEIVETFEETIGNFWSVTRSQVYRELRALERDGLLELGPSGTRDKRVATITPAGREAFARWIARRPGNESIRFPLLLTTFFADAVPAETLAATFAEHYALHEERLASYLATAAKAIKHPSAALTLGFGIEYERAVLAWMKTLPWAPEASPAPTASPT